MKTIKLTQDEFNYLSSTFFLSPSWHTGLGASWKKTNAHYLLTISEEQADKLRDLCGEQLQIVGFDEQYRPTKEGEILESLIDKFFCVL